MGKPVVAPGIIADVVVLVSGERGFYVYEVALLARAVVDAADCYMRTALALQRRGCRGRRLSRIVIHPRQGVSSDRGPWQIDEDAEVDTRVALQRHQRRKVH